MKTAHLTLGGILSALSIICLYLTSILTTNTLTLLTLASFMVPIGLIRGSLKTACLIYISSSCLSFIIVPLNIALLYSLFFGIYGIVKYLIERKRSLPLEIVLKLIFFNSISIFLLLLMQNVLGYKLFSNIQTFITNYFVLNASVVSYIVLWILGQLGFLVFDYALTLLIDYYYKYARRL
ncbi:hypothetical protein [Cellulosilyticum sp. I15G10I2]|uniref:hypothetical protein n=1 Tax=Cellulosilyticum sp. I15G10I2 TaxID=1892843 RepID=UPI00085C9266|nr:hypothetical protein [Cellulosilyticum sp. I15G10I2]